MPDFGYLNARLRGQHSRLLTAKDYEELLSLTDLEAFIRWLENSPYGRDWQLARSRAQGLEAVELALELNFAQATSKMMEMSEGRVRWLVERLLKRWDLQNILAVIRGLHQGFGRDQIRRGLWPVGKLSAAKLDELASQKDVAAVADTLATWKDGFALPLTQGIAAYLQDHDLQQLEIGLLRYYYAWMLRELRGWGRDRALLRQLVREEIDLFNARAAAQLQSREATADQQAQEQFIEGGLVMTRKVFFGLLDPKKRRRLLDQLRHTPYYKLLLRPEDRLEEEQTLERRRTGVLSQRFRGDPLSLDIAVGYLWQKFHEVANLRMIARAKVYGPAPERLSSELFLNL